MQNKVIEEIVGKNKAYWFIQHIQRHIGKDAQVICKICGKTVDECAIEEVQKMIAEWDPYNTKIGKLYMIKKGGSVVDVKKIPKGYNYEVESND